MTGKIRKMFPGGNTANGFYSFFDYIIPQDVNRIFCLKGGPGVGKSSFMKKISKEFNKMGYDVELHYCSSDPSSLDGIVIKELNVEKIEQNRDKIKACNEDISECFQRAFRFLKSAEPIYIDVESKISKCIDLSKLSKITDKFLEKIFADVEFSGKKAYVRHLFGSAITPIGYLDYSDSLFDGVENIYYLEGEIGSGKTTLLEAVYTRAQQKGLDVEVYHFPLIIDKLQAVYIPALDLAVTTSARFKDKKEIDLNTCIDEDKLKKYIDDVKIDKDLVDYLMNNAISNLKRAKFNHDIVEDYYVPAMDFNKVELLKDEIINRILKYKK